MITLPISVLKDALELKERHVLLGVYKGFDYRIERRGDEICIIDREEEE